MDEFQTRHPVIQPHSKWQYAGLFFKFMLVCLIIGSIPLLLLTSTVHKSYFKYSNKKMENTLQKRIEANKDIVDDYFKERLNDLDIITELYSFDYLKNQENLKKVFDIFNGSVGNYEDLGVITQSGFHASYVGPYDLMSNNYSVTPWFKELMEKGWCISDMFLGYRNVPHIIIAVTKSSEGQKWILRATINASLLNAKLRKLIIGEAGETFLLNADGYYQAAPNLQEKVMQSSSYDMAQFGTSSGVSITDRDTINRSGSKILAYAWLNSPKWILILEQDYDEFFSDRTYADRATWSILKVSMLSMLIVFAISVAYIVRAIQGRDIELSKLNMQLMHTGKLASVGQLAAGVAHEINNPLAVIQSEIDLMREKRVALLGDESSIDRSFSKIEAQVERCGKITTKLLHFARDVKPDGRPVDLNENIREIVGLFEKWVAAAGIELKLDLEDDTPKIRGDSQEVGQVFVNLLGNAIDALKGKENGSIHIQSKVTADKKTVSVFVSDSGCGIPPENIKFIFDPFFTTKAVGKGTGLGLSITYSIMKNLGGEITVKSELEKGTEFSLFFPVTSGKSLESGGLP
jgi:two-component system, NtrC family, sensor kinase